MGAPLAQHLPADLLRTQLANEIDDHVGATAGRLHHVVHHVGPTLQNEGSSELLGQLAGLLRFREVQEKGDAGGRGVIEADQLVEAPVTVNGTLVGLDRDAAYRFHANRGDRIVLEVEGRRAGSALDPVLRLLDSERRQLAFSDDALGIGADPRIEFAVPADGEYQVVVHDARFSQQEQNFYRLKIGPITYC